MAEPLNAIGLSPEPFSSVQLIAADLDGSLIEANSREVAERLDELLRSVMHLRTVFTVATGRTLGWIAGIEPLAQLLGWAGPRAQVPAVLYNGSVVSTPDGPLLRVARIGPEPFEAVLAAAERVSASVLAYSGPSDSSLFSEPAERVLGFGPRSLGSYEVNRIEIEWRESYGEGGLQPVAILLPLHGFAAEDADSLERDLADIEGISATRSGFSYIEIRPFASDKAAGLAVVAEHLGIARERVLSIGDNDNDVEMLRWAGIGVSVDGASPAAVGASDFVCGGGAVDGVNQVLGLIHSARRAARGTR